MILAGIVYGSTFVLITVIAHEDYGGRNIPKILGALMTAGAVGIFVYGQLVFVSLYYMFEGSTEGSAFYGKWNMKIFMIALASSGLAFVFSVLVY